MTPERDDAKMNKKKKVLVMVGYINGNYKRKGFREQEGHPSFGRIRTIRLIDDKQFFVLKKPRKVRITIKEI
jgi:hypothetical protein